MTLSELLDDVREQVEDDLAVIGSRAPAAEIGYAYEGAERGLEALACCKVLVRGDPDAFRRDLYWAALARVHYLERTAAEGGLIATERARSRSQAWFCALAAGDDDLAKRIGDLSPLDWMHGAEYEDDFAYQHYLHLTLKRSAAVDRTRELQRFKRALQGAPSPRLELCRALEAGGADFGPAFEDLLDHRAAEMNRLRPEFMDQPTFEPRSRIFVEGLALLRLAEVIGLPSLAVEHALCPRTARLGVMRVRPEDIFVEIANA